MNGVDDIATVLKNARIEVDLHRRLAESQGHLVPEERQTNWLWDAANPRIQYVEFNRPQEAETGADWLWWFEDNIGECFGTLIQAKKLTGGVGGHRIDLEYPKRSGRQLDALIATGDRFDVPAAYILYCGDAESRADLVCGSHTQPNCEQCERASIAVLPALAARHAVSNNKSDPKNHNLAAHAFSYAVPLEDMVKPTAGLLFDPNVNLVGPELKAFLTQPQDGARGVAKHFFTVMSQIRKRQFSGATAVLVQASTAAVFTELPNDSGHGLGRYFHDALRGLRTSLPDYAANLGEPIPGNDDFGVAGVVVVHL